MNKHQKLVQQKFLNDEEIVIKRLKQVYNRSYKDITGKISDLDSSIAQLQKVYKSVGDDEIGDLAAAFLGSKGQQVFTPAEAKETLQSMIQSKVYQKKYQEALKKQVGDVLDVMQVEEFKTVSDYLKKSYEDGFIGTMFDLQGQGIPMCFPLDQEQMVRAVQLDSKISHGLYSKLGEDIQMLKNRITAQVSRGISTGMSFQQVAQQLAGTTNIGYNNAIRIARTEGHRIQCQSGMDACHKAKDMGANVVKQWDSTLDSRTRESHTFVDGEIRELDEKFSNGLMFPGDPAGGAAEVINCRCALLQRAKWALDEDELQTLQDRAAFFGLDKAATFEDYKKKYIEAAAAQQAAPKKTYLTKKKLEQLLADGNVQLQDLNEKFKIVSGGVEYDDIIDNFGSLDDFAKGQPLAKMKLIKGEIDDLQSQLDDWQEKLDKKIIAAETKKLKKTQLDLQDQLDNYDIKTYSGIWKNDVTTADWASLNIEGKKKYYEGKFITENDPALVKKYQDLYNQLKELDAEGKAYAELQKQLNKAKQDLKKLQTSGKIGTKADDAFSKDRKDAALWFDKDHGGFRAADKYFDPPSKAIHGAATRQEQRGFYTYTSGSGGHNRPLAGFEKPWSKPGTGWEEQFYKGAKNVWIDFEGKGDEIRGLTTLIEKSTYADDVWLQSGQGFATIEGFLGIPYGSLSSMNDAQLQQFVGRRNVIYSFLSTAVNEGGGSMFNAKPLKINFFAPKGSQMLYASDVGAFGKGENEMILQRGGTYEITRIYWGTDATDGNRRKIFVDMDIHPEAGYDLFQQDPNEWTGSRKNYHD